MKWLPALLMMAHLPVTATTIGLLWPDGIEPGDPSVSEAPAGKRSWWVDANAPAGGTGSYTSPFNSFEVVENSVRGGDFIYVRGTFDMATNSPTHQMTLNLYRSQASGTATEPTTLKSWRGSSRAVFNSNRTDAQLRASNNGGIRFQNLEIRNFDDQGIVISDGLLFADMVNLVVHDGQVSAGSGVGGGLVMYARDSLHAFTVRNCEFYATAGPNPSNNTGAFSIISEPLAVLGSTLTVRDCFFHDNYVALRHKHAGRVHMEAHNNRFEDNEVGIYLRMWTSEVHANLFVRNHTGMKLETDGMNANHDYRIHNNTFYDCDYLVTAMPDQGGFVATIHVESNIFMDPSGGLGVFNLGQEEWNWGTNDISSWTMANNVFYYTPSNRSLLYSPPPTTALQKNFKDSMLQLADTTSLFTDPLFTNAAAGDFSLTPNSPARGRGFNASITGAPSFTAQPSNRSTAADRSVIFTATADGTPVPTVRWQRSPAGSGTWMNLTNTDSYTGVATTSLSLSNATLGMNGDQFRCVATNANGVATSSPALLTVQLFQPTTIDFNGDAQSDLLWQNSTTGATRAWFMNGTVKGSEVTLSPLGTDWKIAGTADFNSDGRPDLLWQNPTTGERKVGLMNGTTATAFVSFGVVDPIWNIGAIVDLNGDRQPDIIWENALTGERGIWLMLGTARIGWASLGTLPIQWNLAGTGDFNSDNKPDLVWQNTLTGERKVWLMNATVKASEVSLGFVALEWAIGSIADYTGDGQPDIFWQNSSTGERLIWVMNGTTLNSYAFLPTETLDWVVGRIPRRPAAADFNRDGKPDLIWQNNSTGDRKVWLMNATTFSSEVSLGLVGTAWQIAGTGDLSGDGLCDVLWQNTTTGERAVWVMSGTNISAFVSLGTVPTDWQMTGTGDFNADNQTDIVWQNTVTGERGIWLMAGTALSGYASLGVVPPAWQIAAVADLNRDDNPDLIWQNTTTGERKVWLMTGTAFGSEVALGTVGLEWQIVGAADYDLNGSVDLVWQNTLTGERGIWLMNATVLSGYVSLGIQTTAWQIAN